MSGYTRETFDRGWLLHDDGRVAGDWEAFRLWVARDDVIAARVADMLDRGIDVRHDPAASTDPGGRRAEALKRSMRTPE